MSKHIPLVLAALMIPWAALGADDAERPEETPLFLGERYFWQGLYEEALEYYLAAEGSEWAAGVVGASRTHRMEGQYERAVALLEGASRGPKADPELATELAEALLDIGDIPRALELLAAAASLEGAPLRSIVQYGILLRSLGDKDVALEQFGRAVDRYESGGDLTPEELAMVALAYQHLERYHDANRLYRTAIREDAMNLEAQVLWGDLYLLKYDPAEALELYRQILSQNAWYVPALVSAAKAATSDAHRFLAQALNTNERSADALAVQARLALVQNEYDLARTYVRRALEVNPSHLGALIVKAAQAVLLDDMASYDATHGQLRRHYPKSAEFFVQVAEILAQNYRFEEAADFARQGLAEDDEYWNGYTLLGTSLIRLGEEAEGREHLELSFDRDPFNIWNANTLKVFDTLDTYVTKRSEHFVVRLADTDAEVLWPYMEDLLEESWDELTAKYGFTPEVPVLIEMFLNRNDFAVRSIGLPDIGPLVGICFGKVITLISPATLTANWREIIWHEFAHVITLQMTRNRMPRWLSEGISVHEATQARPHFGQRQDLDLLRAVAKDSLVRVAELNNAFVNAESVDDLSFAYYQSYLVVRYVVERHGHDALVRLIGQYATAQEPVVAFERAFEESMADFEAGFLEWIDREVAAIKAFVHGDDPNDKNEPHGHGMPRNSSVMLAEIYSADAIIRRMQERIEEHPNDFQAHLQLGLLHYQNEDYDEAIVHLTVADRLLPEYPGAPGPLQLLAEVHEKRGDEEAVLDALERLAAHQQHDYKALKKLGRTHWSLGDRTTARKYLERALGVNPYDEDTHRILAAIARDSQDLPAAIREYEVLLALDLTDPVDAYTDLAEVLYQSGDAKAAKNRVIAALEIAPTYRRAQSLLLDIVESPTRQRGNE